MGDETPRAWDLVKNTMLSGVAAPTVVDEQPSMATVAIKASADMLTLGKLKKVHRNMNVTALKLCNGSWEKLFRSIGSDALTSSLQ